MNESLALSEKSLNTFLDLLDGWFISKDSLQVDYTFPSSKQAFAFITLIAMEAEEKNHHPVCKFCYNKVSFSLTTHSSGNRITEKDFELARFINENIKKFI